MKKTRFFLMALLLAAVLMVTGCGNGDGNNGQVTDRQGNVQRDVNNGNNSLGEDVRNDMKDAANDVREGIDQADNKINGNDNHDVNPNTDARNNTVINDNGRTVE